MPPLQALHEVTCQRCGVMFAQTRTEHTRCEDCRRATSTAKRTVEIKQAIRDATEAAEAAQTPQPTYTHAEVVAWLQSALEPFYGRPELSPIISSILGKFGIRKGRAA